MTTESQTVHELAIRRMLLVSEWESAGSPTGETESILDAALAEIDAATRAIYARAVAPATRSAAARYADGDERALGAGGDRY